MDIFKKAKEAGIPFDNHESDLYLRDSPETRDLIKAEKIVTARRFVSQIDGGIWWDIPFAYSPWWEAKP